MQLYGFAGEDNKPVQWLEAPETQMAALTDMSPALATEFLDAELEPAPGDEPAALYRAWREGDVGVLEALTADLKAKHPALYRRLLADRNHAWMPMLQKVFAEQSPQLVVVGAAHMAGPDGLLQLLKKPRNQGAALSRAAGAATGNTAAAPAMDGSVPRRSRLEAISGNVAHEGCLRAAGAQGPGYAKGCVLGT